MALQKVFGKLFKKDTPKTPTASAAYTAGRSGASDDIGQKMNTLYRDEDQADLVKGAIDAALAGNTSNLHEIFRTENKQHLSKPQFIKHALVQMTVHEKGTDLLNMALAGVTAAQRQDHLDRYLVQCCNRHASYSGYAPKVAAFLLKTGARADGKNSRALYKACENRHESLIDLLYKNGADFNAAIVEAGLENDYSPAKNMQLVRLYRQKFTGIHADAQEHTAQMLTEMREQISDLTQKVEQLSQAVEKTSQNTPPAPKPPQR